MTKHNDANEHQLAALTMMRKADDAIAKGEKLRDVDHGPHLPEAPTQLGDVLGAAIPPVEDVKTIRARRWQERFDHVKATNEMPHLDDPNVNRATGIALEKLRAKYVDCADDKLLPAAYCHGLAIVEEAAAKKAH